MCDESIAGGLNAAAIVEVHGQAGLQVIEISIFTDLQLLL